MYDKYFEYNPITSNTKLPKHKGILILGATAGGSASFNVDFYSDAGFGITFRAPVTVNISPYILPFQIWGLPSGFASGLTGGYLN
jgi:hypothetical protein